MRRRGSRSYSGAARSAAALIAVLAITAGCTVDPGPASPSGPAAAPMPAPTAPEPDPEPDPEPTPPSRPPTAPDPDGPIDCDAAVREAIETVVGEQLDAFAAEDFTGAYALTSPFFRTFLAEDAFEPMIRGDYAALVGNDGHRFDECRLLGRRAFILAGVRGPEAELVLRYDLSEEADGWRIDGARALDGIVLPPDPLV